MQFIRPKYRFALYIIEPQKTTGNYQNKAATQATICHADSFESKEDGSIVFYHTALSEGKKWKVPVLSYPRGKWEVCIMIDNANNYPVFTGAGNFVDTPVSSGNNNSGSNNIKPPQPMMISTPVEQVIEQSTTDNNTAPFDIDPPRTDISRDPSRNEQRNYSGDDDMNSLENLFSSDDDSAKSSSSNGSGSNNFSGNYPQPSPYQQQAQAPGFGSNPMNVPGVSQGNDAKEFKKQKNDWLETQIKEYSRNNQFDIEAFLKSIGKDQKAKVFRINETDVVWSASSLIRDKSVLARKFSDPVTQKTLALKLPDIMRRQWGGKMGPILQILQELEETKNANAIDLAVWMVLTGFE